MDQKFNTVELTKVALLTALICIPACIVTPLPFTPASLTAQTLAVNLIALLLTPRQTAFTVVMYISLDLTDLPVFSGGMGGPGKLFDPIGDYIMPWIPAVMLMSWLKGKHYSFKRYRLVTILVGMPMTYLIGSAYMRFITGMDQIATFITVVIPFTPPDIFRRLAAALIVKLVQIGLSNAQRARQEAFMDKVFVFGGLHSYIGVRNSAHHHVPVRYLGAAVLEELTARHQPSKIDMIIYGNYVGGGGNITRLMTPEAGLSGSIPSVTVDLQCVSSLKVAITAAVRVQSGLANLVIVGGFEGSPTQSLRSYNPSHPYASSHTDNSSGNPAYIHDGSPAGNSDVRRAGLSLTYSTTKFIPSPHREGIMLQGAEEIVCHYRIGPGEMDAWVLENRRRAYKAAQEGLLDGMTVPVYGFGHDEGARPRLNQRLLDRPPHVLRDNRYLNAANTCTMNDGATFLFLCSGPYLRKHKLSARSRLANACTVEVDPLMSPASTLSAVKGFLERSGLSMNDIGVIEYNEVFVVIDVLISRTYPDQASRYSQLGGILAYRHPYGASGVTISLHLMKSMELPESDRGICCVVAADGIGGAILLEQ